MTFAKPLGLAALILTSQSALAESALTQDTLRTLVTGNTLYVTVPEGTPGAPDGGVAPIYYAADGSAAAQLPGGPKLVGTWAMAEAGYCIDWDNGPKNSCSTLSRGDETFIVMDLETGDPRGTVDRIATGNAENL